MPDLEHVRKRAAHGRLETRETEYVDLDDSEDGEGKVAAW